MGKRVTDTLITRLTLDGTRRFSASMDIAGESIDEFGGRVEKTAHLLQRFGLAASAMGAAGLLAVRNFSSAARDAEEVENKLYETLRRTNSEAATGAIIKQASQLEELAQVSDEAIKSAAQLLGTFNLNGEQIQQLLPTIVRLSKSLAGLGATDEELNRSIEETAMRLGRAFASGQLSLLERSGVVLDDAAKAAFKEARAKAASGDAAARTAAANLFLNAVIEGTKKTTAELGSDTETLAAQERLLAAHIDDAREALGRGVNEGMLPLIKAQDAILQRFLKLNPEVQKSIGKFVAWGSVVAGAVGPVAGIAGSLIQYNQIRKIANAVTEKAKAEQTAETSAEKDKVPVAKAHAEGLKKVSKSAARAAKEVSLLAQVTGEFGAGGALATGLQIGIAGAAAAGAGYLVAKDVKAAREAGREARNARAGVANARRMADELRLRGYDVSPIQMKGFREKDFLGLGGFWDALKDVVTGKKGFEGMEITGGITRRPGARSARRLANGDIEVRLTITGEGALTKREVRDELAVMP